MEKNKFTLQEFVEIRDRLVKDKMVWHVYEHHNEVTNWIKIDFLLDLIFSLEIHKNDDNDYGLSYFSGHLEHWFEGYDLNFSSIDELVKAIQFIVKGIDDITNHLNSFTSDLCLIRK